MLLFIIYVLRQAIMMLFSPLLQANTWDVIHNLGIYNTLRCFVNNAGVKNYFKS